MNKIKVNRQAMNKFVLNYQIIKGYKDAVEKYIRENGIICKLKKLILFLLL